jgi:hypothetical protein
MRILSRITNKVQCRTFCGSRHAPPRLPDISLFLLVWINFYVGVTTGGPSQLSAWPFHLQLHVLIQPASWYGSTSCFPLLIFPGSERGSCTGYMNYTFLNSDTAAPSQMLSLRFCTTHFSARIDGRPAVETLWRVFVSLQGRSQQPFTEGHLNS